jgi:phage terminase large subunit-like protein
MRLHAQTGAIENGFVHPPETAPWLAEYLYEMTVFPKGKHDRMRADRETDLSASAYCGSGTELNPGHSVTIAYVLFPARRW